MDEEMRDGKDKRPIPMTSVANGLWQKVDKGLYYYTDQIVNVIILEMENGDWYLIDTGLPGSAKEIKDMLADHFGQDSCPKAILLTHGHFDHVGGLVELLGDWKIPVYAHEAEFPYLTGKEAYPVPDMTVEGGLLAKISPYYPNEPIDVSAYLKSLPEDLEEIGLNGWDWIHTPGHAPGQVSFFNKKKGLLIAADAFITVKQDSFWKVLLQDKEVCGPPVYLTVDWDQAEKSVQKLAALKPKAAITGHGPALQGEELTDGLQNLVNHFGEKAIPHYGRFID